MYGIKTRFNTNVDGVIQQVGDILLYGHIKFSIAGLRLMIYGLVKITWMELRKELLLLDVNKDGQIANRVTNLPRIKWDSLVDNPAEIKIGQNFFKHDINTFRGIDSGEWLIARMVKERDLREAFIDIQAIDVAAVGRVGVVWKGDRVRKYSKAMRLFREYLLVLAHIIGRQPARGMELVTVQYKNSANGESRGIFIEDGLMVYMTRYYKGYRASRKAKIIYRYLPQEVGELLFYYLQLVILFWRKLESAYTEERGIGSSPFIQELVKEELQEIGRAHV